MPPSDKAAEALVKLSTDADYVFDSVLRDGVTCAAAHNVDRFIELLTKSTFSGKLSVDSTILLERVAEHYARGAGLDRPADRIGRLLVILSEGSPQLAAPIVAGLSRGWPKDKTVAIDDATKQSLVTLISKLPSDRGALVMLANRLGSVQLDEVSAKLATALVAEVKDEKATDEKRIAAASELIELRSNDAAIPLQVLELISPRVAPEFASKLLETTGRTQQKEFGETLVEHLAGFTPSLRATGIRVLLSKNDWIGALLRALDENKISVTELSADQKQALVSSTNRQVAGRAREILRRGGALPSADRQKVVEDFMPLTERDGDPAAGKLVFMKQCSKCHTHTAAGAEGKVGPDLSGFAVHPKVELLIDILDPSRSVEGNFKAYTVITDDGRQITGLLGSESKTSVELVDADAKRHNIQRENIEQFVPSQKSLMPEGFEKQVTSDELANLLAFLTQRGKYLPVPLGKAATVDSTHGMFHDVNNDERIVFDDWSPKTFNGVPFNLTRPAGDQSRNAILLHCTQGAVPPTMPKSVELPCNTPAKAIHFLGGVSGWGFPASPKGTVSMIVRLHYADGKAEDHPMVNGEQLADYLGDQEVPGSKLAFRLGDKQVRYLAIEPKRQEKINTIELLKTDDCDNTAPVVMAVTVEPLQPAAGAATANSGSAAAGPG